MNPNTQKRGAPTNFTEVSLKLASPEKIQVEIKADTEELCQLTSDSAFKEVETDLREAGIHVRSVSACNKGLDGKFRKTDKFVKPNQR